MSFSQFLAIVRARWLLVGGVFLAGGCRVPLPSAWCCPQLLERGYPWWLISEPVTYSGGDS